MIINDTNKQMIREIVVELFKEIIDEKWDDEQVVMLSQWVDGIIANKVDKYEVNVYGASLQEGL